MEKDGLTDRLLICLLVWELSERLGHLHIYYRSNDSIIVLCCNKDSLCLAFVFLIFRRADSPLLIIAETKLTSSCNIVHK